MSTDSPSPALLDLDTLVEKHDKKADEIEPFRLKNVGPDDVTVTFINPADMGWQESQEISEAIERNDLRSFFMEVIEDDDELEAWFLADVPGPVAGKVLEQYLKHYGWDPRRGRLNRAERRARAKG